MALVPGGAPHLRLPLLVHPVDLAAHEHSDPAFAPSLFSAEQVGDEEREAWSPEIKRKMLSGWSTLWGLTPSPSRLWFTCLYNGYAMPAKPERHTALCGHELIWPAPCAGIQSWAGFHANQEQGQGRTITHGCGPWTNYFTSLCLSLLTCKGD